MYFLVIGSTIPEYLEVFNFDTPYYLFYSRTSLIEYANKPLHGY